ncbi:MAG: 1,4-dihydroxy-6-naphthoate synthase [Nitrospirota bacterium]|nr:1,4-dihydroxy-6-naphthoate synthase [Nitrospirota bacterium]
MTSLSLGYSPCPNDTFIFYALVHGRIDTDLRFREMLEDVETLNRKAGCAELDITKISFHAFGHLRETYCLLRSGGALGKGCGPLVVSKKYERMENLCGRKIAIPGKLTTAFLLLQLFDPSLKERVLIMPFHRIIDAVRNNEADAGLIIHESRFTYENAGLRKLLDLGEWWERETGLPIPLGGIIAKRGLGKDLIKKIETDIRKSLEYAFANSAEPTAYIKKHSQELADSVIEQHIGLYVNDYSLDLGDAGIRAVEGLFRMSEEKGILKRSSLPLFAFD